MIQCVIPGTVDTAQGIPFASSPPQREHTQPYSELPKTLEAREAFCPQGHLALGPPTSPALASL